MSDHVFVDAVGANHPRNAWYMAGWDKDLPTDELLAVTMLGEDIVLARGEGDVPFALEDRCPHRAAPLSLGRCEAGGLRCLYHGVRFGADGAAVEVPGQDSVPAALRARRYPLVELHSALWVWMGKPELADEGLIPNFVGYRSPDWAITPGRLEYDAPARLIHDNLLDLSHISYVHAASFGGGSKDSADGWAGAKINNRTYDGGVSVERIMCGMPPNQSGGGGTTGGADVWSRYDFLVPGIFIQTTERYPMDTIDKEAPARAEGKSIFTTFTCQAVTPVTEDKTCYYFAYGPGSADADKQDFFAELGIMAFNEDKIMIEAQFATMQRSGNHVMPLAMDQSLLRYDGVLKRYLKGGDELVQEKEPS